MTELEYQCLHGCGRQVADPMVCESCKEAEKRRVAMCRRVNGTSGKSKKVAERQARVYRVSAQPL